MGGAVAAGIVDLKDHTFIILDDLALKFDKVYSTTAVHLRCLLAASQRAVHGRRVGAHGAGEHRRRVVEAAHGPSPVQVPARGNDGIL